jgi:hypothetical protein
MIGGRMNLRAHDPEILKDALFSSLSPHVVREFWVFHRANPHIFDLFVRFAREAKAAGRTSFATRTILERIRWHVATTTTSPNGFKICDHHAPCYARLLMLTYPVEFAGFFNLRDGRRRFLQ